MKPIYEPKGKAKEYGNYAINIYTGCPHKCFYCFAPSVLRTDREKFHSNIKPRDGIIEAVKIQLEKENITNKLIHLCFTCDPYPEGHDSTATREIIKLLKHYGNHIQILTKGDGSRDFDLLDKNDWYGVTYTGGTQEQEPNSLCPAWILNRLSLAYKLGIKTWVSCEPVLDSENVLLFLERSEFRTYIDKYKIGKLNYYPSNINWKDFGRKAEAICKSLELNYYIKENLKNEME